MTRSINKTLSVIFVLCGALLIGVPFSSDLALPAQVQNPVRESDAKPKYENLAKQAQEIQKADVALQAQANQAPIAPQAGPASRAAAQAFSTPSSSGPPVKYNFENLDLNEFINIIANELGISPIIVDPGIRGTVNIISPLSLRRSDIFPLFSLVLKNNNAALIKYQGFYQIVPISEALRKNVEIILHMPESPDAEPESKQQPETGGEGQSQSSMLTFQELAARRSPNQAPASTGSGGTESGATHMVTYVVRAEFIPVSDLIEPIRLFMADGGVIMSYPRLNMLILTDYSDNADRVLEVVRMLDSNYLDPDLIQLVQVTNNAPEDIIDDLNKIFGGGDNSSSGITFIGLDRLNAILVMANSKRALKEVTGWIDKLDATSARSIQTHFYIVQNSTASNIAMIVYALFGGNDQNSSGRSTPTTAGSGGIGGRTQNRTQQQNSPFGGTTGGFTGGFNTGTSTFGGTSGRTGGGLSSSSTFGRSGSLSSSQGSLGPQLNVQPTISAVTLEGGSFSGLQDTVHMVVDDINNTLVVQSTAPDYAYILDTIQKMDVLPRQVLIDAKVFEVQLNNDLQYGVSSALGLTSTNSVDLSTGASINASGLAANTFSFIGSTRNILMSLQALRSKTKIKVLESPSVLALDGSTASINVGAEIPYPSGSSITTGISQTSINYRQTGVTLMVYPRISASGSVTMSITQEVSSQGGDVIVGSGETAASFNVATVSSSFSVKDGETIAIAGLIREQKDESANGVPFLSEIPIVGSLFGQKTRHGSRTELVILITPHVIKTVDRMREMTQELQDSLRDVRQIIDEHERDRMKDMEDARKGRYNQLQKELKQIKPAKQQEPAKVEQPAESEISKEPESTEVPPKPEEPAQPEEPKE